jgi:hypothetical protein
MALLPLKYASRDTTTSKDGISQLLITGFLCTQSEEQGRVYNEVFHLREGYEPKVSHDDKAVNLTHNINKEVSTYKASSLGHNLSEDVASFLPVHLELLLTVIDVND